MKGWVIGGTSGIGAACAKALGDHMVVTSTGAEEFDVRQSQNQWRSMIYELQMPTHVVYAAGINFLDWLGSGNVTDHQDVVDINLTGFISLVDALVDCGRRSAPLIADRQNGHYPHGVMPSIVAISSDAAERPLRTSIGYCASKAGLNMAVKVAARELGPEGWRINAVSPGMTDETGMQRYIDRRVPEVRGWRVTEMFEYERSQEVTPGRLHVDEVAEVVVQTLMGPAHLNGSIITLNGGR